MCYFQFWEWTWQTVLFLVFIFISCSYFCIKPSRLTEIHQNPSVGLNNETRWITVCHTTIAFFSLRAWGHVSPWRNEAALRFWESRLSPWKHIKALVPSEPWWARKSWYLGSLSELLQLLLLRNWYIITSMILFMKVFPLFFKHREKNV